MEEAPLDRICSENGELLVYAAEGWLDDEVAKLAIAAQVAIADVEEWVQRRIEALVGHTRFCDHCRNIKNAIQTEGSLFSKTLSDPRVFADGILKKSDDESPEKQIDRVA